MLTNIFTVFCIVLAYMTFWFVISLFKRRNDVADVAWGPGFIVVAIASAIVAGGFTSRALLTTVLVTFWGSRLAAHIAHRHAGKPEDERYAAWRRQWGKMITVRSFFQVFFLQGLLLTIVALPVIFISMGPALPLSIFDAVGTGIWLFGFTFEAFSDRQLRKFTEDRDNKGKIMMGGLWQYSRHPNYFGEVTLWWGIYIIALSVPDGWMSIIGPLTITFLILKVSGIPMLEKALEQNPDFQKYKQRTSIFVPLPPRKEQHDVSPD